MLVDLRLEDDARSMSYIDQAAIPNDDRFVTASDCRTVADAIRKLIIRGAPAIGVCAAMAVAVAAQYRDEHYGAYDGCAQRADFRHLRRSYRAGSGQELPEQAAAQAGRARISPQ